MGRKKVKKHKESRSAVPALVRRRDSVDVLERVLTKGAQVKGVDASIDEEASDGSDGDRAWLHVSIAGIGLLNVQTEQSWTALEEPGESRFTTE